jgi:hypothetical protein
MIHFHRQRNFVFLGEERVVEFVYPIGQLNALVAALSARFGSILDTAERRNVTKVYRNPFLSKAMPAAARVLKDVLPKGTFSRLRNQVRSVVMTDVAARPPSIFESDAVKDFVRRHYAGDFALWEEAEARFSPAGDRSAPLNRAA